MALSSPTYTAVLCRRISGKGGDEMQLLLLLGDALLSVVCGILGNMTDRFIQNRAQRRKKGKSPNPPK